VRGETPQIPSSLATPQDLDLRSMAITQLLQVIGVQRNSTKTSQSSQAPNINVVEQFLGRGGCGYLFAPTVFSTEDEYLDHYFLVTF